MRKNIILEDYQKEGIKFMFETPKCLNLDDPGLGKTPQAIGLVEMIKGKSIIIVKPENLTQWYSEIEKFSEISYQKISGSKSQRIAQYKNFINSTKKVLIINYNKVLFDYDEIAEVFNYVECALFDEAFQLKNPNSNYNKFFFQLTKRVPRVVMMTATPVGATLFDFYNIIKVMHLSSLYDEKTFVENFCVVEPIPIKVGINSYIKINSITGSRNIEEFNDWISPYYIKRMNTDSLNIKVIPHKHALECTQEQREIMQALQEIYYNQVIEDLPLTTARAYNSFQFVLESPKLFDDMYSNNSPKIECLVDYLKNTKDQVIVYAKYLEFHKYIGERLSAEGISYESFNGNKSIKSKDTIKKNFIEGNFRVLIITGAGKVGLNLQSAKTLFIMDMPSNPSDVFQLIGRVYRTGQKQDVDIHFVYMKNSLEETSFRKCKISQKTIDKLFAQDKGQLFDLLKVKDTKQSFIKLDYTA